MYIKIYYKNKMYRLKEKNINFIIKILNSESDSKNYNEFFTKYGLYDETFLKNINKLIKSS